MSSSGGGIGIDQVRSIVRSVLYSIFPTKLIQDPAGYVLMVVMGAIVSGVLDLGRRVIDLVLVLMYAGPNSIGLAEIPVAFADLLVGATAPSGDAILGLLSGLNASLEAATAPLGPLAIPVVAAIWVVLAVSTAWVLYRAALLIPTVGPLLESGISIVRKAFGGIR